MATSAELAEAIRASAGRLGANPLDLGTLISYETAGTFDPWKAGPTTQWGQHRGLIQFGEPQRKKYGVYEGMPVADQMRSVEAYLKDAGFKPGMNRLDMYSAINAGGVGRNNRSDANNGGAPGTVADKVRNQMAGHEKKAAALLGGDLQLSAPVHSLGSMAPGGGAPAPSQTAPAAPAGPAPMIDLPPEQNEQSLQQMLAALMAQQAPAPTPPPPAQFSAKPQGVSLAEFLAAMNGAA